MSSVDQDVVDYTNEAQARVAADTRILVKRTTIAVAIGIAEYPLASDVIMLRSVIDGNGREVAHLDMFDVLRLKSGEPDPFTTGYYTVGATIGFYPTPTAAAIYSVFYESRPAAFTSDSDLEVTGDAERLVDRLVAQMKLSDDGQPELAAAELNFYFVEMPRVRARPRRQQVDRIRTPLG